MLTRTLVGILTRIPWGCSSARRGDMLTGTPADMLTRTPAA